MCKISRVQHNFLELGSDFLEFRACFFTGISRIHTGEFGKLDFWNDVEFRHS